MEEHTPHEAELLARLRWLIRLRWLAGAATLLTAHGLNAVLAALGAGGRLATAELTWVAVAILVYNLGLWAITAPRMMGRRVGKALVPRRLVPLACLQIGLDLGALTLLLHLAGGVENPAALFFGFHVIIAGILLGPGICYAVAGAGIAFYGGMAGLEYAGVLRHYHLPLLSMDLHGEPLYVAGVTAAMALSLLSVAYLTTAISGRLRQRERELQASMATSQAKSRSLETLNERLRRVDAERTRFMTVVTHELRAPLSIIYSALDVVLAGYASGEKALEVLEQAQKRAVDLLDMVDDLLQLTQAREDGERADRLAPSHPGGPLRDVIDVMRLEAEHKGVAISVDVAPGLPLARAGVNQMKLVWTNLVSNAVKYTPSGGRVNVGLGFTPDDIVGTVQDTGIGIPLEDVGRVFDEFFRAGNARQANTHGTGVGLSIVRRTLENCGGRITVESELGCGAKFTFYIPRAAPAGVARDAEQRE